MTSNPNRPVLIVLILALLASCIVGQSFVPCSAMRNTDVGDTIDIATGEKMAALLGQARMKPIGPDTYKPSQAVEIVIRRLDDQSQLFNESAYAASLSARGGLFKAGFQVSGSSRQAATRTSQYIVATAVWRQSALVIDRGDRNRMANLVPARLGSHVVTGIEYGGELKVIIEMVGASWREAETVSARLSASGFGMNADVSVEDLVAESGFSGSLALHFVQNGGPEFKMPSLDQLSRQVFDWANSVKEQPTPMNLLVEATANMLTEKELAEWKIRNALLQQYSRFADSLVVRLSDCATDKSSIESVARNPHRYEPTAWVEWKKQDMDRQLEACDAAYHAALEQMALLSESLSRGDVSAIALAAYAPPKLPMALEGPISTVADEFRVAISALQSNLAQCSERIEFLNSALQIEQIPLDRLDAAGHYSVAARSGMVPVLLPIYGGGDGILSASMLRPVIGNGERSGYYKLMNLRGLHQVFVVWLRPTK